MDRTYESGAAGSPPSAPASPSSGYPTAGSPSPPVPATKPGPWWYHMMTEEIRAVIVAAGLTPDHTDVTQLAQAIQALFVANQKAVVINSATFEASVVDGEVVQWDSANSRFDEAVADGTANNRAVGVADVTNSKVYLYGECALFSGLTPGARYYLDASTPGAITTTAPTDAVMVGIAKSATTLWVDVDVSLASAAKQIQPITASVAANALTLTLNPTSLDFRSATLGSGTVNTRAIAAPISMTVSAGSTLGTINGQTARIAVLAIDNAGTVELACVNLAGGNNLDETTLISTTAEGGAGAADAANVIYSTTARANVPFRVVGYIDITQATAGTWATAPSTIQGAGGQVLAALSSLGYGQTWQNVTRVSGTTYYNTTGKPIILMATADVSSAFNVAVNGLTVANASAPLGTYVPMPVVVPPGASYVITDVLGSRLRTTELR